MQTIGLIGGVGWEPSDRYRQALGGASLVMSNVDFGAVAELETADRWDTIGRTLAEGARGVAQAGADFVVLCTTDLHKVAGQVQAAIDVPLLHEADVVAAAAHEQKIDTVAFLGSSFAMQRSFFTDRLATQELVVHVPDRRHHGRIDKIITEELAVGRVEERSRKALVSIIGELWDAGAGGVILGCSDLELLIHQGDSEIPIFPAATLHVAAVRERALAS